MSNSTKKNSNETSHIGNFKIQNVRENRRMKKNSRNHGKYSAGWREAGACRSVLYSIHGSADIPASLPGRCT
jgi:hypothetical protein